ncbi:MAG: 4Fe-4S binding protein [Deltaproteobacteria bacterium]
MQRPFPALLKNHSDLVVAFAVIFIIWLETATHMRQSPLNVGLLLLTITLCSVAFSVIFERQSWCRYLCPLGGMTGLLAKASIVELRADQHVCASQCTSHECYFGNGKRQGCPFGQVTPTLESNLHCTVCGTCIKNCPHGAVNLNLRIPGQELLEVQRVNTGTAFLVLGMIGGLLGELISRTPMYGHFSAVLPLPEIGRFTAMFLAVLLGVNLLAALAAACSQRVSGDTFQENYSRYGLALLPLTLTAFISFHLYYLINLGVQLPILVSQNFDLAIFRQLIVSVPPQATLFWQRLLIVVGLVWSLLIMYRHGKTSREKLFPALMAVLPHALLAIALAGILLVLIETAMHP